MRFTAVVVLGSMLCGVAVTAHASVDVKVRERGMPHVCSKGPRVGLPCDHEAEDPEDPTIGCPNGTCVLKVGTQKFKGTLTITTDESVAGFNGTGANVVATAILFEVKGKFGPTQQIKNPILSQLYQDTANPTSIPGIANNLLDFFPDPVSTQGMGENDLELLANSPGLLSVISRTLDCEMADELRNLFNSSGIPVSGTPVVIKTKGVRASAQAGTMATVLEVQVTGAFLDNAPDDPCP